MATCSGYQQQLEVALEIHACPKSSSDITEQVRKKVSSGGADEAREQCLPPPGPLLSLQLGPGGRSHQGAISGSARALESTLDLEAPICFSEAGPTCLLSPMSPEAVSNPPPHGPLKSGKQSQNPQEVCWAMCPLDAWAPGQDASAEVGKIVHSLRSTLSRRWCPALGVQRALFLLPVWFLHSQVGPSRFPEKE